MAINKCPGCGETIGFEKHVCKKKQDASNSIERAKAAADLVVYGTSAVHEAYDGTVTYVDLVQATYLEGWRAENREHYNAKQREYQKAYRERKKLEKI